LAANSSHSGTDEPEANKPRHLLKARDEPRQLTEILEDPEAYSARSSAAQADSAATSQYPVRDTGYAASPSALNAAMILMPNTVKTAASI
jgi:hypothetical protein